jgi:hypothetical protein
MPMCRKSLAIRVESNEYSNWTSGSQYSDPSTVPKLDHERTHILDFRERREHNDHIRIEQIEWSRINGKSIESKLIWRDFEKSLLLMFAAESLNAFLRGIPGLVCITTKAGAIICDIR